jgi:hypothetical protein
MVWHLPDGLAHLLVGEGLLVLLGARRIPRERSRSLELGAGGRRGLVEVQDPAVAFFL